MRVLLVRHGETEWTKSGQHTGTTELPLTEHGMREVTALRPLLRELLGERVPVAVFSSPRRRVIDTARAAFGADVELIQTDELAEFNYGAYEGLTVAQIHERDPGWNIWTAGCPEGEMVEEVGTRADAVIKRAIDSASSVDDVVALCSHGHMTRVLAARLLGLPAAEGRIFAIGTAAVAEVKQYRGRFVLGCWNLRPKI